ncbi:MAG: hypothetical protein JW991_04645 [Candidatus Pacebacteria bacterium]|nr:hypothetical protein [Candidatus Paceibacterota bacterium]
MKTKKTSFRFWLCLLSLAAFLLTAPLAKAYYYDDEEDRSEVYVVKKVSRPRQNNEGGYDFVYELGEGEAERYQKNQVVAFEIRVKNTGEETLSKVVVTDKYPNEVDFPRDDDDNWDDGKKEYRYEIFDLGVDEEAVRTIEGRVTSDSRVCVQNQVWADPDRGETDYDDARFCLGKETEGEVLGVKAMPETGVSALIWLAPMVFLGTGVVLSQKRQSLL